MADLSHLDGAAVENPDRLSDAAKKNIVNGNTVKSLDTGHTEASLKDHMAKEMELLAIGNGSFFTGLLDGLLGELIELIKKYLKDPLSILEDGFDLLIKIGGGALSLGIGLGEAFFEFLSDIGGTIVSLFTNEPRQLPPAFSQLRADLEGDVAPFMESFKKNGENAAEALGKVGALREEVEETLIVVERDIRSAEDALKAIGDVDKKIADQALIHIRDSEEALEKAKGAVEALAAYKDLIDPQIRSALDDAQDGLDRLEVLEPQIEAATKDLSDYKAVIDPKIQSALADAQDGLDRLDTLEPKVSTAISDLAAYEEAINAQIQDLLGKASDALEDAGQALTQYDDLFEDHEVLKTDTKDKIAALNDLTAGQGVKISAAEEKANAAITGTVIEYAVGTSETTAPTTGWSTSTPTRAAGRFTWMRSKVTYGSGESVTTSAALITGNTGTPGTPGTDGTPGKAGLGLKSTTVTYVTSTSGATAPSSGWTAAVPTLTKGRYLWTKTLWTYTDDSTEIGYSVAYLAKDGSSGTDGLPGKDGVGITGTAITYAASSSGTTAPTSGWVANPPAGAPGQFIWTKTVWTYSDSTTETGYTVGKIGNTGAAGAKGGKGADGLPGKDGVGVKTTVIEYVLSTSGTTAPTSGWNAAVPTLTKGRYLWTRTLWTYTDNSTETGHSVSYIPTDGSSGTDGLPGKDGVGITGTAITYAKSSSGTSAPTSGWVAQPPATSPGDFMWTKTVWTYSDKTTETGYTVGKIGNTGAQGAPGATGADGVPGKDGVGVKTTVIEYALSTSGTAAPTSGWSLTVPALTKGRYLWTKTLWTYTDSSTETGHSVSYIPTNGSNGTDGLPGKDGVGITGTAITYAASSSGTSAPTSGWVANPPAGTAGQFIWTKTVWTYSDKTTETGYTVGKIGNTGAAGAKGATGATGATGAKGSDGLPGKDGVGVKTTTVTYVTSTSGTTAPTTGWTAAVPTLTKGRYLWTRTLWTYTDNSTETGYSVAYVAKDGSSGTDGLPGKDGVGITGTAITYAKSSSGTSAPTSGWVAQPPATSPGDFIWTKTVWTYSDKTTETGYTVGKIGNTGAAGAKGATGATGGKGEQGISITSATSYYRLVTKGASAPAKPTTVTPSGWSTTEPNFEANRELYRVEKITYSDGTFSYTGVSKVSAYTASTEAMNTAVDALAGVFNSTDIGSSLVAYIPGTSTPVWAETMTPATPKENPQGLPEAYVFSSSTTGTPLPKLIAVNPGIDYKISAWFKADKPNSRIYLEIRDQDDTHAVKTGTIGGGGTYLVGNFNLPTAWTLYESVITFRPEAKRVKVAARYSNHSNGTEQNAVQYMADLRIDPVTVTPGDVTNTVKVVADSLNNYRTANDKAVGAANKTAQDAAGLAGGKGEVIYSTATPPTAKRSAANLWIKGPNNTPHVWNGSAWTEITDQAAKDAAKAAANANTLAEKKTTTYYQTSAPSGTKTAGDLWIDQSTAGKNALKRWSGSAWVVVQDKAIAEAMAAAGTAQSTADGKVQTFAQTSAPTGVTSKDVGDLWIDTDDGNKLWRWSGSKWVSLQDKGIVTARELAEKGVGDAKTINDAMTAAFASGEEYSGSLQLKWNKLVNNVDDSQNIAIQGLTASTMLAFPHLNIAPEDSAGRPWWSIGMDVNATLTPPGYPSGPSYWTSNSHISNVGPEALITVVPGIDYKLEFWAARVDAGTAGIYADLRNSSGTSVLTHWVNVTNGIPETINWSARNYAGVTLSTSTDWVKQVYLLRVRSGVDKVALHFRPGSTASTNGTRIRFWGAHLSAFMPIQEQLDAAQTGAILALDKINDSQDGLIAANNKAINAAKDATVAHQRILSMAYPDPSSVIPMVPGGVNTGTVAKPVYEAMPAWLEACARVTNDVPPGGTVAAREVGAKQISPNFTNAVAIDSNISYRFSFWVRADRINSQMVIAVNSSAGGGIIDSVSETTGINYPASSTNDYLFDTRLGSANIPTSWTKVEGAVKFKEGTKDFRVSAIYFSHNAGVSAAQYLADFEVYPEIPRQSDVNKALADVNAAQTAILTGHQSVLDMAFPNTNLVPMNNNGVPVWASTVGANPVRTPEGNWQFASGTAVQPGTGGKHVPTVNGVVYRAIARVRRTSSGTSFSIRIRKAGGATNVTRTAVTNKPALPGAARKDFITTTGNVSAAVNVWETWYYDFTLANNTGDVRIGYVIGSEGVEVAQFDVVALLPDQTEVNRINNEINTAQSDILHDHQRVLDLMNPPETVVAMHPGGLNIGTDVKPEYVEFPYWLRDSGSYSSYAAGNLPDGNRVAVTKTTSTTPTINGHYVPVTPGGEYRYEFYFKATAAKSGLVIYMTDDAGNAAFQSSVPDNPAYGNASGHLWWSPNMPGGTGPDGNGFYRITGKAKVRDNVTRARISRIYYNWSSGSVTTSQTITGLRIWPDVPSQQQVDEAQNTAIDGNTKAIRLAFPDMNLDPQTSAGRPEWSTNSLVTVKTTGSLGGRNPSYQINGRVNGGLIKFQPDIREYRIRGWITPGSGSNPFVYVYILNESGEQLIEAWRPTFPEATTEAEELAGSGEVKWTTANTALFSANGGNAGNPGEWEEMDVVVRLRAGDTVGKIQLYSTAARWVTLSDFRVTAFAPSQWQVDYSQNKALSGLAHSISVQNSTQGEIQKAIGPNGLGGQVDDLEQTIRQVQSYIPRSMVMNLGATTPNFNNDHFKVDNNNDNIVVRALNTWTGHMIITYGFGTSHETYIREYPIPFPSGERFETVTSQKRANRHFARIDYWIDNGEQVTKKIAKTPNVAVSSGWSTRTDMTFKVLENGFHIINFKVEWPNTSRRDIKYGVQIKRNGTVINTLTETNIGPTFPWEDGRRSQSINWSGQLTKNQTITFEVYTTAAATKGRTLGKEERRISWVSK